MILTIYDFNKIMSDIDSLRVTNYHKDVHWICPLDGICYRFNWEWHGYSGSGMVCLLNNKVDPNNEFCKESLLSIHQDSIRQAEIKHISEVYNEPDLVELMQYIADTNTPN